MDQPILETERLILRPFVDGDAPRIAELAGDKSVADTTLRIPHPYSDAMALEWIGTHKAVRNDDLALFYAVDLKESGELVGSTGIDIDFPHSRATIGYWIGRGYWNKGYATEAASILFTYVFDVMKFHKVDSHHFVRNPASGRVLEKLGMKREGLLRGHIKKSGAWEDIIEYGILDHEYKQLESSLQRSG